MHLEEIRLINFKNYADQAFRFSEELNCFVGDNGAGKTNLLEAIHYLSLTRGFLNTTDQQNIRHGEPFFSVIGEFERDGKKIALKCQLKKGEKKVVSIEDKPYEKLSEHVGVFPSVLISPNDTDIIRGASENRRKYFDGVMSQLDATYLDSLVRYNHALKQRNAFLKQAEGQARVDKEVLEPYNRILIDLGRQIHEHRSTFIESVIPRIQAHYEDISDQREHVKIRYASDLESAEFPAAFRAAYRKDLVLGRTTMGVHRDDYQISIDGHPIRKFGSQGQQKSMIVALKLAQFDVVRDNKHFKPLLLLDDIFDKLDEHRINKIMQMVAGHAFGQIFVTDARPERTLSVFKQINSDKRIFRIRNGKADMEPF